jgi:antitoxin component HigA of HigAB toxin-antitoxin module
MAKQLAMTKMEPLIKTEEEHRTALAFAERLMDSDPDTESKEGQLLLLLAEHIHIFEKRGHELRGGAGSNGVV